MLTILLDESLSSRIQNNHIRDQETMVVTKVEKLEPLALRKEWMNDLAQALAFLESHSLAHGDLRPENILLDRNRLKLSDFDCTAEIGSYFEACIPPYGRVLNSNEPDQGRRGSSGLLGPRTELFALGSLYYLINYGFEVYGDRCLTNDPKEHGPRVVNLLQNMEFPELNGDPLIDGIIDKCWHNKYTTVSELAAQTQALVAEETTAEETKNETIPNTQWHIALRGMISELWYTIQNGLASLRHSINGNATKNKWSNGKGPNSNNCNNVDQTVSADFISKRSFCQDLERRGLLHLLSSGEPEQLGFTLEWYRYAGS